jgi:hypothetical protein
MGYNAGKDRYRDDEVEGSAVTYSGMEVKKYKIPSAYRIPEE